MSILLREAVRRARPAGTLPHRRLGRTSRPHALLWTLPDGDANFPGRWRAIKIALAKSLPAGELRSPVMTRRGERGIWQRRYWEHTIRTDRDFAAHMDYTHFNPVKHGLVGHPADWLGHPADWPHSSFHRSVTSGLNPAGWSGGSDKPQQTGERI